MRVRGPAGARIRLAALGMRLQVDPWASEGTNTDILVPCESALCSHARGWCQREGRDIKGREHGCHVEEDGAKLKPILRFYHIKHLKLFKYPG